MIKILVILCAVGGLGSGLAVNGHETEKLLSRGVRMVNGSRISIERVPWQVSLLYVWGDITSHFCGGSIISSNWVITAGYCVEPIVIEPEPFSFVSAGANDYRKGSRHTIAEKFRHPLYREQQRGARKVAVHDIALLRVVEPFIFDRTRQPIPLYVRTRVTLSQLQATASGWSAIEIEGNDQGFNLQSATMKINSVDGCKTVLSTVHPRSNLPSGQICVEALSSGIICSGDSGGPLTVNGTLVGIASWPNRNLCTKDYPLIFTEVAPYRYWISEITLL